VRLVKIKNNTIVYNQVLFHDYIDYGEYYLLTVFWSEKINGIILNKNTTLERIYEEDGGYLYYSKFCKTTFHMYESEGGKLHSDDMDEVINWTKINTSNNDGDRLILKALVTGEGLEEFNFGDYIVRWPNENGGRGESWYGLVGRI
jgi:hypothetical protein